LVIQGFFIQAGQVRKKKSICKVIFYA